MVTVIHAGKINIYWGLSTDEKPIQTCANGSIFYCIDTGDMYIYDEENLEWRIQ